MFTSALNSDFNLAFYGDKLTFGTSLKWPFEELQFLTLQWWINFSAQLSKNLRKTMTSEQRT